MSNAPDNTLFIAGQTQTEIIDMTSPFDTFRGYLKTLFCADGIHPNAYGYRLIADDIFLILVIGFLILRFCKEKIKKE